MYSRAVSTQTKFSGYLALEAGISLYSNVVVAALPNIRTVFSFIFMFQAATALTFAVKLSLTTLNLNVLSIYYLNQVLDTCVFANIVEGSVT